MPLDEQIGLKKKEPGIYILSPDPPGKVSKFKIGRSVDLRKRINEYHICFPYGFYIYMICTIKHGENEKETLKRLKSLEKSMFILVIRNGGEKMLYPQEGWDVCPSATPSRTQGSVSRSPEWIRISDSGFLKAYKARAKLLIERHHKDNNYKWINVPRITFTNNHVNQVKITTFDKEGIIETANTPQGLDALKQSIKRNELEYVFYHKELTDEIPIQELLEL